MRPMAARRTPRWRRSATATSRRSARSSRRRAALCRPQPQTRRGTRKIRVVRSRLVRDFSAAGHEQIFRHSRGRASRRRGPSFLLYSECVFTNMNVPLSTCRSETRRKPSTRPPSEAASLFVKHGVSHQAGRRAASFLQCGVAINQTAGPSSGGIQAGVLVLPQRLGQHLRGLDVEAESQTVRRHSSRSTRAYRRYRHRGRSRPP